MPLYQWSTTPANNASAGAIDWAEGQPPSTVNDSARQMMADVAAWYATPEWLNYGLTPTYVSGTQFTLAGNQTALYSVGRRVRTFNTGGTLYGTITASAYTSLTTVTVSMDTGAMDSGLSEVDVGIINASNTSSPAQHGQLVNVQVITASGTYTPTAGANSAIVIGSGSGGASGGLQATTSGQSAGAGAGGSGAFGVIKIPSGSLTSQTVTIGAAGAGTAGTGGTGGTCSFGSLMVLPGGAGGFIGIASGSMTANQVSGISAAPSGSGSFIWSSVGASGTPGFSGAFAGGIAGNPGYNMFGPGGYGSGAFAGAINANQSAANGQAGFTGAFIVYEYS